MGFGLISILHEVYSKLIQRCSKMQIELCWDKDEGKDGFYTLEGGTNSTSIEGFASEWLSIANAIDKGESASFSRCCAVKRGHYYELWSPRNSYGREDLASLFEIEYEEFTDGIKRVLGKNNEECVMLAGDMVGSGI